MEYNVNVRLDAYNKHLVDSSRVCEESEDVESQDLQKDEDQEDEEFIHDTFENYRVVK